jgi:hypothetical protein
MINLQAVEDAADFVHTAETLMAIAELRWRAAAKVARSAQDAFDSARRVYASARSDYTATHRDAVRRAA